jgi:alcohol dehydrogenase class IV
VFDKFYNTSARSGFHWPGRLIAGEGVVTEWLAQQSGSLVIVADARFASHQIVAGQSCAKVFISREPHATDIAEAVDLLGASQPDAILALGGGSTIDSAKAISAHLRYGTTEIRDVARDRRLPILVAAPTTAGSGSETSRFFIVSDPRTGIKTATRSWSVVPELTLLDPDLISGLGVQGLVLGAFDAAIHLWETMMARGERSTLTDDIARAHLPRILRALPAILSGSPLSARDRLDLMQASAMAGVAISNVRTGLIHTLGESLASQIRLAHPMTLRIFLRPALESYAESVADHARPLWAMCNDLVADGSLWSTERFIKVWEDAFHVSGLDHGIADVLEKSPVSLDGLCDVAARDTTLMKENPIPLDAGALRQVAELGLSAVNPR